jgi:hypothetical protein
MKKYMILFSRVGKKGGSQRISWGNNPKEAYDKFMSTYSGKFRAYGMYEEVDKSEWDK